MSETSKKTLSLTGQSAWLLFAKVTGFVLSFILPLLVVRYLSQTQVGIYRQAFLIITNAVGILPLGFSMSAYYFLNREPEKRASTITNILLFNFLTGGLACLTLNLYPQLLGNLFQSDEMTQLAPKVGIVIWLWIFSTFLEVVALANQEAKTATVFIILAQFTKTGLMAGAVILFTTVESFVYAAMAQGVLQIGVLVFYLNSRFPRFWKSFDLQFFREQIIYALPFGCAGLLYTIQTDVHNYFVGHHFSAAEMAIYTQGCFELPLIAMLYESISAVMIPRMSEMQAQGKKREMFLTTVAAMRKLAFIYFPMFIFLMIVADIFITTLFTKNYAASIPIFRINILLIPFYCLMLDPIGRAFPEIGRFLLKVRIIIFVFLFAALWFGMWHFDLRGMISIVVVGVLIERVVSLAKIVRILEIKSSDFHLLKDVGKTAIAAVFAGVVLLVFYLPAKEILLAFCLKFSLTVINFLYEILLAVYSKLGLPVASLTHLEKFADFFGGSLFLAICLTFFAAIYWFAANRFGIIESEDKAKLMNLLKKLKSRRSSKNLDLKLEASD